MTSSSLLHAIAGAGGSILSQTITYPLYTLTVRAQLEEQKSQDERSVLVRMWAQGREIVNKHGLGALFVGLKACLIAVTLQNTVYYYWFDVLKKLHRLPRSRVPPAHWNLLMGFEAGIITVLSTNAFWVINAKQMTRTDQEGSGGWFETIRQIYQNHGLSGFLSGLLPAMLLCLNPAFLFFFEAAMKRWLYRLQYKGIAQPNSPVSFSSLTLLTIGWIAKVLATTLTFPMQSIKIHRQKAKTRSIWGGKDEGETMLATIISLTTGKRGFMALYQGLEYKIIQTGLTSACMSLLRERLVEILHAFFK